MVNFSIKFSFSKDNIVYHKTAIVRASSADDAKDKLIASLIRCNSGKPYQSFAFGKISVSSYNYVFV